MRSEELKSSTGKVFLQISYEERNHCVYNNWMGYVSPENVKQGCLAVLDFFYEYGPPHCLNDNRELVGPWDQAVEWIEEEWMPRAIAAGLRCFAHVVNQEAFAAASAANMLSRVNGRFAMRIFDDIEDARHWLSTCK